MRNWMSSLFGTCVADSSSAYPRCYRWWTLTRLRGSGANRTWWDKVWTGDAYTLNLVKCTVGSVGFVVMGLLTTGGGWLSAVTPAATLWLVLSSFLVRTHSAVLARKAPTASLATLPGSPEAATRAPVTPSIPANVLSSRAAEHRATSAELVRVRGPVYNLRHTLGLLPRVVAACC